MWSVLRPSELRRHMARWLWVPGSEDGLRKLLRTRMNFFMRKNLDGTYTVTGTDGNPYQRRRKFTASGLDLEKLLADVASQIDENNNGHTDNKTHAGRI